MSNLQTRWPKKKSLDFNEPMLSGLVAPSGQTFLPYNWQSSKNSFLFYRGQLCSSHSVSMWVGGLHVSTWNYNHSTLPELVSQSKGLWKYIPLFLFYNKVEETPLTSFWLCVQFLCGRCVAVWGCGLPSSLSSLSGIRIYLCLGALHPLSVGVWQRGWLWRWFRWGLPIHLLSRPIPLYQHTKVNPNSPQLINKNNFYLWRLGILITKGLSSDTIIQPWGHNVKPLLMNRGIFYKILSICSHTNGLAMRMAAFSSPL